VIILYTKKLQHFLEITGSGVPLPEFTNPDAYWHGNIFLFQRKKVLQLTHEKTRYTIFIHGIVKKDLKNIDQLILKHLRYHILRDGLSLREMKYIDSMSTVFSFFKKIDRKVLGTMNNMKDVYQHQCLTEGNIDDREFSNSINHMLFQIDSQYKYPVEAFKEYMLEAALIREIQQDG